MGQSLATSNPYSFLDPIIQLFKICRLSGGEESLPPHIRRTGNYKLPISDEDTLLERHS